jgi:hypothetical protein
MPPRTARTTRADKTPPVRAVHAGETPRHRLTRPLAVAVFLTFTVWPTRFALYLSSGALTPWAWLLWGLVSLIAAGVIVQRTEHHIERHLLGAGLLLVDAWAVATVLALRPAWELEVYLGVGVLLATGAMLLDQEEHGRATRARDRVDWPFRMAGTPWEHTRPKGEREPLAPGVWRQRYARLAPDSPASVDALCHPDARARFEERLDLPRGSARVIIGDRGKSTTDVIVTVVERDPHSDGLNWIPQVLDSITEPLRLGKYADDTFEEDRWWTPGRGGFHRLIAGITRSGKSHLMKLLVLAYAGAEDVVLHMIDAKGGMTFRKLAALFAWWLDDPDEGVEQLEALVELIEWRTRRAAEWGWDPWRASAEHPVHIAFIDELAKVIGVQAPNDRRKRALEALITIAQTGAGVGVLLCCATQYPTLEALASSQFREQFGWAACFRLRTPDTQYGVIPNAQANRHEPADIPEDRPGTCYIQKGDTIRDSPLRCFRVLDGTNEQGDPDPTVPDTVSDLVTAWWEYVTPVPEEEIAVMDFDGAWSRHRTLYTPDGSVYVEDPEGTDVDAVELLAPELGPDPLSANDPPEDDPMPDEEHTVTTTEPTFADLTAAHRPTPAQQAEDAAALATMDRREPETMAEPESQRLAWELLLKAGRTGLAPVELWRPCNRSDSWGYKLLRRWRTEGHAQYVPGVAGKTRVADRYLFGHATGSDS